MLFSSLINARKIICQSWDHSSIFCLQDFILWQQCSYNFNVVSSANFKILFLANVNSSSCSLYVISSVRLSSVCRLSVTLVHPTQTIAIFGNVSTPFGTLALYWHPGKILRRSSQGTPPSGELIRRGVAEYSDFGPIDGYISETVQDRRYVTINH